jgi:hypothetical protein
MEKKNGYKMLVRKSQRAILLGRPRLIWDDNIKRNV